MSKINYLTFSEAALKETETPGTYAFTDEYEASIYNSETETYTVDILTGAETFIGDKTGDAYYVDDLGKRNDTDGLFKGVLPGTNGSKVNILNRVLDLKRINNLGLPEANDAVCNKVEDVYGSEKYDSMKVFHIAAYVNHIEENALKGLGVVFINYNTDLQTGTYGAQYVFRDIDGTISDEILLNPSYGGNQEDYVIYKNAVTYDAGASYQLDTVYGLVKGFENGPLVSEGVLTLPFTDIYSFDGEYKKPFVFDNTVITKVVVPTNITITGQIDASSNITISYDSVDYTSAGTGNNDSYTDLNAKLITDGVCAEGFDFVVTVE